MVIVLFLQVLSEGQINSPMADMAYDYLWLAINKWGRTEVSENFGSTQIL